MKTGWCLLLGGRRWYVLECDDDREKDYAYFRQ